MADKFAGDQIEELLDRTARGEPLTKICADERMPGRTTVYNWIEADSATYDAAFAERFRVARARGIHALAEECIEIADKPSKDAVEATDKRLRIDTRLRLAGKWLPSAYGEKVQHVGDGGGPMRTSVVMLEATPQQAAEEYAKLLG